MTIVKQAEARLAGAQKELNTYFEQFKAYAKAPPKITDDGKDARELKAKQDEFEQRLKDIRADRKTLATTSAGLKDMKREAAEVKEQLDVTNQIIDQDNEQNKVRAFAGVSKAQEADTPLGPYRDTRFSTAIAGALGGIALGIGSMILLGVLRGTIERPDDANPHLGDFPMLGMVPVLPDDLADPEHAALAAHCVHEIRMRLQILGQGRPNSTFAITSPSAGAGKTSLTLALGLSFAAASQKTLLIDCDVIGGGLTRQADAIARRRLGAILLQDGWINKSQLDEALRTSRRQKRQLGEMLVQLGYVTEPVIASAMAVQQGENLGLIDAMQGGDVLSCITPTGIDGLYVMPLGSATVHDAAGISIAGLRRLLDTVGRYFNVVIIDTGPILGSLEASVAASQADAVVLAVAKGSSTAVVEKSLQQLSMVGTRIAGMVFNRALDRDVIQYGSHQGSSHHSTRTSSNGVVVEHREVPEARPYGPVARAVASWSPAISVGSRRARKRAAAAAARSN
jgi:Mrp family chromosome partitioning ATPase